MSKINEIAMMYAMMGMMVPDHIVSNHNYRKELTDEEIRILHQLREKKKHDLRLKRGLKEWDVDGIIVIALNKKNAVRKAKNIKRLIEQP